MPRPTKAADKAPKKTAKAGLKTSAKADGTAKVRRESANAVAEAKAGAELARANQPLPPNASDAAKKGYEEVREQLRNDPVRAATRAVGDPAHLIQNPAGGNPGQPGVSPLLPDNPDTPENESGKPNENPDTPENETPRFQQPDADVPATGRKVADANDVIAQGENRELIAEAGGKGVIFASNDPQVIELEGFSPLHLPHGKTVVDPKQAVALRKYLKDRNIQNVFEVD